MKKKGQCNPGTAFAYIIATIPINVNVRISAPGGKDETVKTVKPFKRYLLVLSTTLLLAFGAPSAMAGLISLTETFDEFGPRNTDQDGFNWQFSGLNKAIGDLTIQMDWTRMDFNGGSEWMDISADGGFLGRIGNSANQSCSNATDPDGNFFSLDCTGSISFTASGSLIDDAMLSLTSVQNLVDSSGGAPGSPFGFISATLTYTAEVPEPSILALMGVGLIGFGFARRFRNRRS